MTRIASLSVLLFAAVLTGCAAVPYMPLAGDHPEIDPAKPLYLMSVAVRNEHSPRWQPRILNVILVKDNGTDKPEPLPFRMDAAGAVEPETDTGSTTYLVRFATEPGRYTIRGFNSMGSAFPLHGFYFVPLHADVPEKENGVHYLGSIRAVIRERKENEFRAGPLLPLIDQAVTGASTGSFDIEITDAYDSDVDLFRKTFAPLRDIEVRKDILPAWEREKAQLFWEQN